MLMYTLYICTCMPSIYVVYMRMRMSVCMCLCMRACMLHGFHSFCSRCNSSETLPFGESAKLTFAAEPSLLSNFGVVQSLSHTNFGSVQSSDSLSLQFEQRQAKLTTPCPFARLNAFYKSEKAEDAPYQSSPDIPASNVFLSSSLKQS